MSLEYNKIQLDNLSIKELINIAEVMEITDIDSSNTKDEIVNKILNHGNGSLQKPYKSIVMGIMSGPVLDIMYKLDQFYKMKAEIVNDLMQMSDTAIYAMCEQMGLNVELDGTENGYVIVNNSRIPDRDSLIWYLISMRFAINV